MRPWIAPLCRIILVILTVGLLIALLIQPPISPGWRFLFCMGIMVTVLVYGQTASSAIRHTGQNLQGTDEEIDALTFIRRLREHDRLSRSNPRQQAIEHILWRKWRSERERAWQLERAEIIRVEREQLEQFERDARERVWQELEELAREQVEFERQEREQLVRERLEIQCLQRERLERERPKKE